jgi:hypothetical protein
MVQLSSLLTALWGPFDWLDVFQYKAMYVDEQMENKWC